MASLAELFAQARCEQVSTYIQSGNVVFSAKSEVATGVPAKVCAAIEKQFGFQTHVVMRNQNEMDRISKAHPFLRSDLSSDPLHVVFLAAAPSAEAIAALDPRRSTPDEFRVMGQEIYLYLPNGMGQTKLTNAYFDSKLKTVSTARNWRTVQRLLEMMQA